MKLYKLHEEIAGKVIVTDIDPKDFQIAFDATLEWLYSIGYEIIKKRPMVVRGNIISKV